LIRAPRDGIVFRLLASPGAELVKAGDPLVVLIPDTESRAVELWVDGNDVPLLEEGRAVRLQFEGWPAVQFSGWPSVAVGTFGGRIGLVDPKDDGSGRFRILVVPDEEDEPWPAPEYLRQGARANGFVLLDQVSLGYELWRQANGFPPTVAMRPRSEMTNGSGK
jgi:adhesin transport system membrane fusion protein